MNLFPIYQQRKEKEIVKKGKFYSTLYILGFALGLIVWIVVISLPNERGGYVSKIYPPDYDMSDTSAKPVPTEKIEELKQDPKKKNVRCICSNPEPVLNDFANIKMEQYSFCPHIMEKYNWETCIGKARAAIQAAGDLCPEGIAEDEPYFENIQLRKAEYAYAMNEIKGLCYSAHVTLIGLQRGALFKTVSSPAFMKQGDLQKILDSGLESQFIVQFGATFTSLTASFGFGRMNLPFRIMKVNAAKDAFEDVDVNTPYYAVPEKSGILGPEILYDGHTANPAHMQYFGSDKYEDFMYRSFTSAAKFYKSCKDLVQDPWKTYCAHFEALANNNGIKLPKAWFESTKRYQHMFDATTYFFLKEVETGIDMEKYHKACAPKYCEYVEEQEVNLGVIIGVIIGVAGSISACCKATCGILVKRGVNKKVGDSSLQENVKNQQQPQQPVQVQYQQQQPSMQVQYQQQQPMQVQQMQQVQMQQFQQQQRMQVQQI